MIVILLLGIILVWLFGYNFSGFFVGKKNFWEKMSIGFILGMGIFTFLWFLLNLISVPYNLVSGFILIVSLNGLVLTISKIKYGEWLSKIRPNIKYLYKLNLLEKIGIGILIFLCVSAFIQNLYWPIRYWDSLVLYDFRAKVFAATGFMQPAISRGYFFGYPLLTSLAHAWVYILGGTNPSFLYTFFYISFLLNFGINIKKMGLSRPLVIAMTVLVSISPRLFEHTQWAYTNLPYIIYIVLGSIYLYWGIKNNDIKAYLLSGIMVGLSTWTRNVEPFWLSVLIVAMVSTFFNKRWFWFVMMTSLVFIIMMPWRIFESFYKQGAGINVASQIINTSKGIVQNTNPTIFKSSLSNFWANFIFPYVFYVVIFTIVLFFKIINKSKNLYFIFIVILDLGLILGGIFTYVTYVPYVGDLSDSLTRMAMFFPPLVVFLLSEYLSETKS